MEGGIVYTHSLRLRSFCLGVLVEACLSSVLVSMEDEPVDVIVPVTPSAPDVRNVTGNVSVPVKPCWNWAQESQSAHKDCALGLLFTSIILSAGVIFVLLLSVLTFHLKRHGSLDLDCCVNAVTQSRCWTFFECFLPLFGFVTSAVLLIVFVGLVLDDGQSSPRLPDWLNLRELMVNHKPWRFGLTCAGLAFAVLACIPAGQLAGRWYNSDLSSGTHLQRRSRHKRRLKVRPNQKTTLLFEDAEI